MTQQSKHTPGPWVFRKEASYEGALEDNYISAQGEDIMGDPSYYPFCPNEDADWHLIAAAPDLLEALEAIVHTWDGPAYKHFMRDNIDLAKRAIAKAKGSTE